MLEASTNPDGIAPVSILDTGNGAIGKDGSFYAGRFGQVDSPKDHSEVVKRARESKRK